MCVLRRFPKNVKKGSEEVAELLEVILVLVKFIVRHGAFGPVSDLFRFIAIGRRDGRDPELVRNSVPAHALFQIKVWCWLSAVGYWRATTVTATATATVRGASGSEGGVI